MLIRIVILLVMMMMMMMIYANHPNHNKVLRFKHPFFSNRKENDNAEGLNCRCGVSDRKDAWRRGDFRLRTNFWEQIEKKVMLLLQKFYNTSDITRSGFEENKDHQ